MTSLKLLIMEMILNALIGILNICVMLHRTLNVPLTQQYIVCLSHNTGRVGTLCERIEESIKKVLKKQK